MAPQDLQPLPEAVWGKLAWEPPPTRDVLLQVAQFLEQLGYTKSLSALRKEAKRNAFDLEDTRASEPLNDCSLAQMWQFWRQEQEPRSGDSSDGESDSDSSDNDDDAAQIGQKRKRRPSTSSSEGSSSDSESDSESDSDSDGKSSGKSDSGSDASSASSIRPTKRVKAADSSDTSDSESSSESSAKAPTPYSTGDDSDSGSSAKSEASSHAASSSSDDSDSGESDSSTSSSSSSEPSPDSDSSSSDSDSDSSSAASPPPKKRVKREAPSPTIKMEPPRAASDSSVTLSGGDAGQPQDSTALTSAEASDRNNGDMHPSRAARMDDNNEGSNKRKRGNEHTGKKENVPFSRIPKTQQVDSRFASNAYVPYDYAERAHRDLIVTKGKGFTKEKNKKKRGSYRGGLIDLAPKGIKFED